jgi:hypothetical protein
MISTYAPNYVRYQYFDFHEECKHNKFENAELLIDKIRGVIDSFGITVFDTKLKKLVGRQSGVVRTNCLDCLDRTNYIQSRVALYQLRRLVEKFSPPETRDRLTQYQAFSNKQETTSPMLKNFNAAWAENGDKISLHYTGIGSTHTEY